MKTLSSSPKSDVEVNTCLEDQKHPPTFHHNCQPPSDLLFNLIYFSQSLNLTLLKQTYLKEALKTFLVLVYDLADNPTKLLSAYFFPLDYFKAVIFSHFE